MRTLSAFAVLLAVAASVAACGHPATTAPHAGTAPSSPASHAGRHSTPSAPVTVSGARTAATGYFDLYAAQQYAATWALLSPAAQQAVTSREWVKVHRACAGSSSGMAYKIGRVTLAGNVAVVNVSLAGALSKVGSEEQSFTYARGRWGFAPSDLSAYKGRTAAQAVSALKSLGLCG